jgi:hypothetical protein
MPMRRVLPGGATLGGSNHGGDERPVACRPGAAVVVRTSRAAVPSQRGAISTAAPQTPSDRPPADAVGQLVRVHEPTPAQETGSDRPPSKLRERLSTVKLLLEVLAVLVGLIGAILALVGLSRR